ncbi:MAG: ornithine cyclodeaminase family protein [Chloroflexota bacterium]
MRAALPMAEAIEGMKQAFAQLSAGRADAPLRTHLAVSDVDSTLIMPAHVPDNHALAIKIVSVFGSNIARDLPLINALVLALDDSTGQPLALMEGGAVTAIRTGAASGAATDILARPDARVAAIFGSGVQARTQLEAVCTVRPIEEVRVFSLGNAEAFVQKMAGYGPIPTNMIIASSPAEAVRKADIICTATTARAPVFDGANLKPGVHINAIGAFTPEMQEIDPATVVRSRVVVDSRSAALEEAGDLIIPLNAGLIDLDHIATELGDVILGRAPGRTDSEQITFSTVGVAVQDAAAARIVLRNGPAMNLGQTVTL